MEKDLVSVIIPVYKTEAYLNRCVESIVNQTYRNLEIILVDDGSPDNCPQMCDAWAEKDARIKVLHKKNEGSGSARNTGIETAAGEYIYFVDSDDFICPETIEKAYKAARDTKSDIVIFGVQTVNSKGEILRNIVPVSDVNCYSGSDIQNILLPDMIDNRHQAVRVKNLPLSVWSCMISMELIKETGWRFVSERSVISEDSYSLIWLYKYVRNAAILPEALYCYRENESSLSHSLRWDRHEKNRQFYLACCKMAEEQGYGEEVFKSIGGLFLGLDINAMRQIAAADLRYKEKRKLLLEILRDQVLQSALKSISQRRYGIKKETLYWAMRHKYAGLCYLLCVAGTAHRKE